MRNEISENLREDNITLSQLTEEYGSPAQMANQLRKAIPDDEYYAALEAYKKRKR